jgi:hypothetical protein
MRGNSICNAYIFGLFQGNDKGDKAPTFSFTALRQPFVYNFRYNKRCDQRTRYNPLQTINLHYAQRLLPFEKRDDAYIHIICNKHNRHLAQTFKQFAF